MARRHNDRTSTHVVERAILQQHVAAPVKIVHSPFYEAIFDVVAAGIVGRRHPCVLKRTEGTVEESGTVTLRLHGKGLRPALAVDAEIVDIRDARGVKVVSFHCHHAAFGPIDRCVRIVHGMCPIGLSLACFRLAAHIETTVDDRACTVLSDEMDKRLV